LAVDVWLFDVSIMMTIAHFTLLDM